MRSSLVLLIATIAAPASAGIVSGQTALSFEADDAFRNFGVPTIKGTQNVMCSETCSEKPFFQSGRVTQLVAAADSSVKEGMSTAFVPNRDGAATTELQALPGSNLYFDLGPIACSCRSPGIPQDAADYRNLKSNTVSIPPHVFGSGPEEKTYFKVGEDADIRVTAAIFGSERLIVKVEGAGVSESKTFEPIAETRLRSKVYSLTVRPSQAGALSVTATVEPGATATASLVVAASSGASGSKPTAADVTAEDEGCQAAGGASTGWALVALAFLRRRPRRR